MKPQSALFLHLWKRQKKKLIGICIISYGGRIQFPAGQSIYVVVFTSCETKHPSSDLPGTGGTGSRPAGQQFVRQMEKAEPPAPLNLRVCQSVAYLSAIGSTADYREMEFLAPLPHVLYLGHHFEPTANSTKNIIIKMPVAREEREKEKRFGH